MEAKAIARNISVSPRKLRLICNEVRGRKVEEALTILRFMPTPSAAEVAKAVKSAAANAQQNYQMQADRLRIAGITATDGMKLKRFQPMARGRAGRVQKRHAHITVVVDEGEA